MTPIHEEAGSETEWVALPGFQVCREPLSVTVSTPEAAETAVADQADVSKETEPGKIRKNPHQLVHSGLEADALYWGVSV